MRFAFGLFLRLPSWLFVLLAGLAYVLSLQLSWMISTAEADLSEMARSDPPEMTVYEPGETLENEIAVRLTVDFDNSYRFFYESEGPEDYIEYFMFLESGRGSERTKEFGAVIVFESDEAEVVTAWLDGITLEEGESTSLIELRGFADSSDYLDIEADEALSYFGATKSENFVYIRPFIEGREVYYAAELSTLSLYKNGLPLVTWAAIALCLLVAVIKMTVARFFGQSERSGKSPSKLATASAAYGATSNLMGDDDDEDDADDLLGDFGTAFSVFKLASGFLRKRKQPVSVAAVAAPEPVEPEPSIAKSFKQPTLDEVPIYTPPQATFLPDDEYDALIEAADARAKALSASKNEGFA